MFRVPYPSGVLAKFKGYRFKGYRFMCNKVAAAVGFCVFVGTSYYLYNLYNTMRSNTDLVHSLEEYNFCEQPKMILGDIEHFKTIEASLKFSVNPDKVSDMFKYLFSRTQFSVGRLRDDGIFSGSVKVTGTHCDSYPSNAIEMGLWEFINYFLERVIETGHNATQCSAFSFVYSLRNFINNYNCFGSSYDGVCERISRYYYPSGEVIDPPEHIIDSSVMPLSHLTDALLGYCERGSFEPRRMIRQ